MITNGVQFEPGWKLHDSMLSLVISCSSIGYPRENPVRNTFLKLIDYVRSENVQKQ